MANEVRLIDANKLWIALDEANLFDNGNPRHIAQQTVEEQPTVDAVEVVRCKDCIHFNPEKALRPGGIWCEYWGTDPDPEDWCCKGERRTDEGKAD